MKRLKETRKEHATILEEAGIIREDRFNHDAQRLLGLKASISRISGQTRSQNEKPHEKPEEKPKEKPTEKPQEKPKEKPKEKPADKPKIVSTLI